MQTVYDTLKHFAFILGDHDSDIDEQYRKLHRGVKVTGTDEKNQPVLSDIPYILRSMVTIDPDTNESKHGSFSMAIPCIVEKKDNTLLLRALNHGGEVERKLKGVTDWELPNGGQEGVHPGMTGVLVVGTEIDEEKKIFHPTGGVIVADHRGANATLGSTIVNDLQGDDIGLGSRLAKTMWIALTPTRVDAETRTVVSWNSLSMGARSGKAVEHQGGAITLYNSNIRTSAGTDIPRVVSWAAWLDDGPFFEGEGHRDEHIKGLDAEGVPHLPLMFRKDRAKFGPGPERSPSAPFDFLEKFAVPPRYSQRIFRAEIVYDKKLYHPNPSGLIDPIKGRWVIEYRLPHNPPTDVDDPGTTKAPVVDDPGTGKQPIDPSTTKPPVDDPGTGKGKEDTGTSKPETPEPKPKPPGPITGEPSDKDKKPKPGPGSTGGGPGTCGHPGEAPKEPGPKGPVTGPGQKPAQPQDTAPPKGPTTQEKQEQKQAELKKKREAEKARASGATGNVQHPEPQTNIGSNLSTLLHSARVRDAAHIDRAPMRTHLQAAYPVLKALIPNPEPESQGRLTLRDNLNDSELLEVDSWSLGSTQIVAYGDVRVSPEVLTDNKYIRVVNGGWVIAGADLKPDEIYEGTSNLTARLLLRNESRLTFGTPNRDGTVTNAKSLQTNTTEPEGELRYTAETEDIPGAGRGMNQHFHFYSPARVTNVSTSLRNSMTHKDGVVVVDTDENIPYMSIDGEWVPLAPAIPSGPLTEITKIAAVPQWFKFEIPYTLVESPGNNITITIASLPVKAWIHAIHWKVTELFTSEWSVDAESTTLKVSIGDSDSATKWLDNAKLLELLMGGEPNFVSYAQEDALGFAPIEPNFDAEHELIVTFVMDPDGGIGETLEGLTGGVLTVWFLLSSMNEGVA